MIVCVCHRVSDRHIAAQAAAGCASFEELQFETGVATGCGCCRDCAVETFERHRQAAAGCAGCCTGACPGPRPAEPAVAMPA